MAEPCKAYECGHGCGFYLKTRKSVEAHEAARCCHAPMRHACISCHFLRVDMFYYPHYANPYMYPKFNGTWPYKPDARYCEKDHDIYDRLRNGCPDWQRSIRSLLSPVAVEQFAFVPFDKLDKAREEADRRYREELDRITSGDFSDDLPF